MSVTDEQNHFRDGFGQFNKLLHQILFIPSQLVSPWLLVAPPLLSVSGRLLMPVRGRCPILVYLDATPPSPVHL